MRGRCRVAPLGKPYLTTATTAVKDTLQKETSQQTVFKREQQAMETNQERTYVPEECQAMRMKRPP
jgi:hypothetical protein